MSAGELRLRRIDDQIRAFVCASELHLKGIDDQIRSQVSASECI